MGAAGTSAEATISSPNRGGDRGFVMIVAVRAACNRRDRGWVGARALRPIVGAFILGQANRIVRRKRTASLQKRNRPP